MILCLRPSRNLAQSLAIEGGEVWQQLHVTLGFYPDEDEASIKSLMQTAAEIAKRHKKIPAKLSGYGRFTITPKDALYVSINAPALEELRADILENTQLNRVHGFTPHMTLAYLDPETPSPILRLEPKEYTFQKLHLWIQDRHLSYPLQP